MKTGTPFPKQLTFLVTEENVHTALVYGILHDEDEEREVVIGSLRTSKITLDPDEFIKEVFGHDNQGRFFGGRPLHGRGASRFLSVSLQVSTTTVTILASSGKFFDMQIKQKLLRFGQSGRRTDQP